MGYCKHISAAKTDGNIIVNSLQC